VTPTSDRHGVANSAYHFDGSTGAIQIPNAPLLNNLATVTVSAWVKADTTPGSAYIVRNQISSYDPGYMIRASNNSWMFGVGSTDTIALASGGAKVGVWTQLVGTYDGARIGLYINGALVVSTPFAAQPGANTLPIVIGGSYSGQPYQYWFQGSIGEVRIFGCAMTAAQVAAAYDP
jgi:hypothetical protein